MKKPNYTFLVAAILSLDIGAFQALAGKPAMVCLPDIVVSNEIGQCSAIVTFTVLASDLRHAHACQ